MIRFTNPLVRVAQRLKSSEPITICRDWVVVDCGNRC